MKLLLSPHRAVSPEDRGWRTVHFYLWLVASANDPRAEDIPSKGLPSPALNELCPQPGLGTVGPELCNFLPAGAASSSRLEWFFPLPAVEMLCFLSAHPASPVSAPEQAENVYLHVTGGGATGGEGAGRGPGAGGWWQVAYPLRRQLSLFWCNKGAVSVSEMTK